MKNNWRDYLAKIFLDKPFKREIAKKLKISVRTLDRWISGEMKPRMSNLQQLLIYLPQSHRTTMLHLLSESFPAVRDMEVEIETGPLEISSQLYGLVIADRVAGLSAAIQWGNIHLILRSLARQIDGESRQGVIATVAQCVKPEKPTEQVKAVHRSYIEYSSWTGQKLDATFAGSESVAGHTVQYGRPVVVQDATLGSQWFILPISENIASFVGMPIRQGRKLAGSLVVASTQEHYFSATRLDLISKYAELLSLTFTEEEFYPPDRIDLSALPSYQRQRDYLIALHEKREFLLRFMTVEEVDRFLLELVQGAAPHDSKIRDDVHHTS